MQVIRKGKKNMTRVKNSGGTMNPYVITGNEVTNGDRYGYKIIAVVQSKENWCAYYGLTDWSDYMCAVQGEKVPYEVAKFFFSTINIAIPNYDSNG